MLYINRKLSTPLSTRRNLLTSSLRLVHFFSQNIFTRLQQFPALMALVVQCCSFVLVFFVASILLVLYAQVFKASMTIPLLVLMLLQASVAATISHYVAMASWWRWIHFVFPISVYVMLNINIPNELYLFGFLITLSIFWTTFRTQVPYYPSRLAIWKKMAFISQQLQDQHPNRPIRIIDIGSGLGGLSLHLAKAHATMHIEGIEIAPLPWLISRIRAVTQNVNAQFRLGNYHALNLADYDIVFAYLSPAAMPDLWKKSNKEMHSGALLVSLEFTVPHIPATQCFTNVEGSPDLFVYQIHTH